MPENRYSLDAVDAFVRKQLGLKTAQLDESVDLFEKFGVDGDDCVEFMDRFSVDFRVDLSGYLWYFHHGEEPHLGALVFGIVPPSIRRGARIPITPDLLLVAANTGKWPTDYPAHSIPERRYDVLSAWGLSALILCLFAVGFLAMRF